MPFQIPQPLIPLLRSRFRLDWHGIHGAPHWARVRQNGLLLAERSAPAPATSSSNSSPSCTTPAATTTATTRCTASARRTRSRKEGGKTEAEFTVQVCWDADRLDLGRVGHVPDPERLCTNAANDAKLIEWAYRRSLQHPGM